MVEVGQLEIVGTIDTANIDAGLLRIRGSLRQVSDSTKPLQSDLGRMSNTLGKMSLAFVGLGAVGIGLFSSLARDAPALAGAFARADVATGKLKRTLGREFKDAADSAVGSFERLVSIVQTLEGTGIVGGALTGGAIGATLGGVAGTVFGGPLGGVAGTVGGGILGAAIGGGGAAGISGLIPGDPNRGIIPRLAEGFLSRESDRKFNLFNIIDSVFG